MKKRLLCVSLNQISFSVLFITFYTLALPKSYFHSLIRYHTIACLMAFHLSFFYCVLIVWFFFLVCGFFFFFFFACIFVCSFFYYQLQMIHDFKNLYYLYSLLETS